MTARELDDELEVDEVYLVTTLDGSLIGSYAGVDEHRRLVFVPGPLPPLAVPAASITEWERLS